MTDLSFKNCYSLKWNFLGSSFPTVCLFPLDFTLSPMPNNNLIPKKDLIMGCKKVVFKSPQRLSQSASIFPLTSTESALPWELSFILFKGYFPSITGTKILPLPISCSHCPKCILVYIHEYQALIHLCLCFQNDVLYGTGTLVSGEETFQTSRDSCISEDLLPSF